MTRRYVLNLATFAAGGTATLLSRHGIAATEEKPTPGGSANTGVAAGKHAMLPLPFDAKKLKGLSEKLLASHHENNYGGALRNLNKVEDDLARITKDTPGYVVAGLRERELTFTNSVILHELYFGNLGGNGKAAGAIHKALGDGFGTVARWEELFRATCMSLAGGSGWVVLDYNFHTGDLRTYAAGNHTQSVAFGAPLLVMDMFEHAYAMDFGAAAAKYIDAFFANVRWDEVNRRFDRAERGATVLRG